MSELHSSLNRLEVSPTRQSQTQTQGRGHGTVHVGATGLAGHTARHSSRQGPVAAAEFSFDESQFTESYYRSWEGDIDTDEDITATGQGQFDDLDFEGDTQDEFGGYPTSPASSSSSNSAQSPQVSMNTNVYQNALRGHLC